MFTKLIRMLKTFQFEILEVGKLNTIGQFRDKHKLKFGHMNWGLIWKKIIYFNFTYACFYINFFYI